MRVLAACSLGGAGHLHPLLPLLAAAERRGDEILVVAPPAMREMVGLTGYPFRAGGEPSEAEVAPIRERLPLAPPEEASYLANQVLFGRLATNAMLPRMELICAEWLPDLVVRDPCEYSSAVVAHRMGIPTVQVGISLADVEDGSITHAAPALEALRTGLVEELRASPYLTSFPASLDPSLFASTVRFSNRGGRSAAVLPDWWDGSKAPLVYVTLGTVLGHMSMAAGIYRTVLQALTGLDVRVLLTVGRQFDPSGLGPVPANVRVEAWVDQADVLHQADLVVCHGGSGTVLGALGAGVPLVGVPLFADQFENARRISAAGAGLLVEEAQPVPGTPRRVIGEQGAIRITEAIEAALGQPSYRRAAGRLSDEMRATPTADEILVEVIPGVRP